MKITVIGTGFVGVVSAAVFASLKNTVTGLDIDEAKVASLTQGKVPFFEPGLEELLISQQAEGRLTFTTNYIEAISEAELIIIAVGTPSDAHGHADLRFLYSAVDNLLPFLKDGAIVAIKSTVPPGTVSEIERHIKTKTTKPFSIAALPEFLREGTAVADTLKPDRVVVGADDPDAWEALKALHQPFGVPIIKVRPESAHMAKYSANAYLANRITFINQIADLCEKNEADIEEVIQAIGMDKRIGSHYWYPGFGYGGSCFPKDVRELAVYAQSKGEENNLFSKLHELNEERIPKLLDNYQKTVGSWKNKTVAVLGLSFKPHTNDMREAPSVKTIPYLLAAGAQVRAFDPQANDTAPFFIHDHPHLSYFPSLEAATQGVEIIMVLIEWPEIIEFDFSRVRNQTEEQWFIDARNQFAPTKVEAWGYNYLGIGR